MFGLYFLYMIFGMVGLASINALYQNIKHYIAKRKKV